MNRDHIVLFLSFLLLISASLYFLKSGSKEDQRVEITLVVPLEITPIEEMREGFYQAFRESEHFDSSKYYFREYNTEAYNILPLIITKIGQSRPALVFSMGTQISAVLQNRFPDIPTIQGGSYDPVAEGLADSWNRPGRNFTAVSDYPPIVKNLELISDMLPDLNNLGILSDPEDPYHQKILNQIRKESQLFPFNIKEIFISSFQINQSWEFPSDNIEAVYVPPSYSAYSQIPRIGNWLTEKNIPFFANTPESIKHGALSVVSPSYKDIGFQSGQLAIKVLFLNQDPSTISIELADNPIILINSDLAKKFQVDTSALESKWNYEMIKMMN